VLWVALTALLAWYYSANDSLGSTYGPLVGVIALLTWAYASAFALFMGIAFAAQLEAVRAGVPTPIVRSLDSVDADTPGASPHDDGRSQRAAAR
jgi:uncharacterized BrkB/YihY/UPF0761 family membrane protein